MAHQAKHRHEPEEGVPYGRPPSARVTLKGVVAVFWAGGLRREHGDRRCAGGSLGFSDKRNEGVMCLPNRNIHACLGIFVTYLPNFCCLFSVCGAEFRLGQMVPYYYFLWHPPTHNFPSVRSSP